MKSRGVAKWCASMAFWRQLHAGVATAHPPPLRLCCLATRGRLTSPFRRLRRSPAWLPRRPPGPEQVSRRCCGGMHVTATTMAIAAAVAIAHPCPCPRPFCPPCPPCPPCPSGPPRTCPTHAHATPAVAPASRPYTHTHTHTHAPCSRHPPPAPPCHMHHQIR